MARVCIICFSGIATDGRVQRYVESARNEYEVDVYACGPWVTQPENVRYFPIKSQWPGSRLKAYSHLLGGRVIPALWDRWYWQYGHHAEACSQILAAGPYDIIHANDIDTLPIALKVADQTGAKVVFDAHEYHPGQARYNAGRRRWTHPPFICHLLRTGLPRVDAFVTSSTGFVSLYRNEFGFTPEVIESIPVAQVPELRQRDATRVRIVHHGVAKRERQPETMIEMMQHLDERFSLDMFLLGDAGYLKELQALAATVSQDRVQIRPPMQADQIVATISAEFDVGIHVLPATLKNFQHLSPNKIFEYICAGLAVVCSPNSRMSQIVQEHNVGVIADSDRPADLAKAVAGASFEQWETYRENAIQAAKEIGSGGHLDRMLAIYRQFTSRIAAGTSDLLPQTSESAFSHG